MRIGPMELMLVLGVAIPWIITIVGLIDAIQVRSDSDYRAGSKLIWVLVILFFNCVGAAIYYAIGRPAERRG